MKFYKRTVIDNIIQYIDLPEAIILHGSRQVGKSTVMKMVAEILNKKNANTLFMDLEDTFFLDLINKGYTEFIKYLFQRNYLGKKLYLFIDEIQYLDTPSQFIKLLVDNQKDKIKLIASGSSSFAIKSKFKDSLVGRIIDFEIFGLSFSEFLIFKEFNLIMKENLSDAVNNELLSIYKEFILYGSYPRLALEKNISTKEMLLKQIITSYVKKDLIDLAKIKELQKYNHLLKILADSISELVNIHELSNTTKLARQTLNEYLFIMENTYIIKQLYPFFKNIRSELSKMSKLYFEDTGLVNILKNNFFNENLTGEFFENSIYTELRKNQGLAGINYWRTTDKQEIDFIISVKNKIIPVEVKLNFSKTPSGLKYFMEKYNLKQGYICSLIKQEIKTTDILDIQIVYPWELIYILNSV
jgi:uncharacterized protein